MNINQPMPTSNVRGERHYHVDGPCVVATISGLCDRDGNQLNTASTIGAIGDGRDPRSHEQILADFKELEQIRPGSKVEVAFYDSILTGAAAHPDASPVDSSVRSVLAGAKRDAQINAAQAAWREAIAAAGREVCDRCGGAGGHAGWPGYTCYDCGGRGSVQA